MGEQLKGQCLCGSVKVAAKPNTENVDVCHCSVCRKWSAGPYLALSCADNVEITGDTVSTFRSSEWAERLFCNRCGTPIVWRLADGGGEHHVNSELFNETGKFPLGTQVFIDEKPSNYDFAQQTNTMTGAEVFALFAPEENADD